MSDEITQGNSILPAIGVFLATGLIVTTWAFLIGIWMLGILMGVF